MFFGGDDDDDKSTNQVQPSPDAHGGLEAGNYAPPADLPIPGQTEGIDDSKLG